LEPSAAGSQIKHFPIDTITEGRFDLAGLIALISAANLLLIVLGSSFFLMLAVYPICTSRCGPHGAVMTGIVASHSANYRALDTASRF
jgi:hypothetical protein